MKTLAILASVVMMLNIAEAQWRPDPNMTVIGSVSGQFFVSARGPLSTHSLDLARAPNMMTLEPALLAVSCERIKHALLHELNMQDQWHGKIFVILRPARTPDDSVRMAPQKLGPNWDCSLEMPDVVDRNRFLESMVRACLLEIANRNAVNRSTEIPEWLARGLTRQLMGSGEIKLILPPPHTVENGLTITRETIDFSDTPHASRSPTRKMNPLTEAVAILRTNAPISFDELSWPTDEQLSEDGPDVYGSCAQLFVNQLLHVKKGPDSLRDMLAKMPNYLNWQLAFLDAFQSNFQKPLDIEKWWAIELAQFSGRDLMHLLTVEESARQLDAVFQFPIQVQIGQAPPMRTGTTLQTIIRGAGRTRQLQTVKAKLWELDLLRLRIAPSYIPLVDQYRLALQEYSKKRSASARILADIGVLSDKSASEAIIRLDTLDAQRAKLRTTAQTPIASNGP